MGGCAQAAALAEFRADWATAVKTYLTAYAELCRAPRAGVAPLQRWAELCAVAELVHLKARADPRTLGICGGARIEALQDIGYLEANQRGCSVGPSCARSPSWCT